MLEGQAELDNDELLTVGQVANLIGVSIRTLHHWDQIDLVKPSARSWAGYRLYTTDDIARLHQVLVYRETGMPLAQVAQVLDDRSADTFAHLKRQRQLLVDRISHLTRMLRAVDTMMEKDTMGNKLTPQQRAEIMGDQWDLSWDIEAEERWGNTEDWKVSAERMANQTPEEFKADKERIEAIERKLAAAMAEGVKPGSEQANALAEEHRVAMNWFDVTHAKQVIMARSYVNDPRLRKHYDDVAPGLAQWLKEIVDANAVAHGLNLENVSWE